MATGGKVEITAGNACPVCLGEFDQPKVLQCDHVFCRGCLEQWLHENKLTCPVCRGETKFKDGFGVGKLPEPMIFKDETEKVTTFLSMSSDTGMVSKTCGFCKKQDSSSFFCESCHKNLCDNCQRKHKTHKHYSTHKLITISKLTLCDKHTDELITFYCCDCCQGLCSLCVDENHLDDHVIEINDPNLVQGKKDQLKRFIGSLPHGVKTLIEHKVRIRKSIRSLGDSYDQCEQGLIRARKEVIENIDEQIIKVRQNKSAELKRLALYEEEIENMIATRNSLDTYIKSLKDTAAEIVLSADNLPDISNNAVPVMPNYAVPSLNNKVTELITCSKSLINIKSSNEVSVHIPTPESKSGDVKGRDIMGIPLNVPIPASHKTTAIRQKKSITPDHKSSPSNKCSIVTPSDLVTLLPRSAYMHRSEVRLGSQIGDITYDSKVARWWVRTSKPELLNISLDGKIDTRMTKHIPNDQARICIDTKRDQLILVDRYQGLVCLSRRVDLISNIKIPDCKELCGVTHCPNRDVFIVTDGSVHCLWFVSSESGKVLHKLGSRGDGDKQFYNPFFICHQNVGEAECKIVVSDCNNCCIKLFTCAGEFIRKFGTGGTWDRQLQSTGGVCVDPWGRIIVCDSGVRVVCFWWVGAERFEVLLNREQLGGKKPWCVSVSDDGKQLLVGMVGEEGIIEIYNL